MLPSNIHTSFLNAYIDSQYIYHDVSLSFPGQEHHLPSPHHHLFTPSTKREDGLAPSSTIVAPAPPRSEEMPVLSPTHNFFPTNRTRLATMAKKRASKRDRHSKIFTRQGPRDRRMRLSLEVARKFFDLQYMLGFDKASKTIGWLLKKSKAAIRELSKDLSEADASASSMSECEVISRGAEETIDSAGLLEKDEKSAQRLKKKKLPGKTSLDPLAKAPRAMARAKARERTEEKMRNRKSEGCSMTHPNSLKPSRSSSPGKAAMKESGSLNDYDNPSLGLVNEWDLKQCPAHLALMNPITDAAGGATSNSIFDYCKDPFLNCNFQLISHFVIFKL